MVAGVTCLLLAFALTSSTIAYDMVKDPFDSIKLQEVRPGEPGSNSNTLKIRCAFVRSKTDFANVYKLGIVTTEENEEEMSVLVAATSRRNTENFLTNSVTSAEGKLDDDGISTIEVTWVPEDEGYCRTYMCIAIGLDSSHKQKSYSKNIKVETAAGTSCVAKQIKDLSTRVDNCCEASQAAQDNTNLIQTMANSGLFALPKITQKQGEQLETLAEQISDLSIKQDDVENNRKDIAELEKQMASQSEKLENLTKSNEESLEKIMEIAFSTERWGMALGMYLSINKVKYDVSTLYNGSIYIASKDEPKFDLEKMNGICQENQGYLAEIDDDQESKFLQDFVTAIGKHTFAIGANDVEHEGEFVYYHSKKPVPDSLWMKNQPSNSWGIENCAQIRDYGINDIKCDQSMRYICEIRVMS